MKNPIAKLEDKIIEMKGITGTLSKGSYALAKGAVNGLELAYSLPYLFRRFGGGDFFGERADGINMTGTYNFIQGMSGFCSFMAGGFMPIAIAMERDPRYLAIPILTNAISAIPTIKEKIQNNSYAKRNGKDAVPIRRDLFSQISEGDLRHHMKFDEIGVDELNSQSLVDIGLETYEGDSLMSSGSIKSLAFPYQQGDFDDSVEESNLGRILAEARLKTSDSEDLGVRDILGLANLYTSVGDYFRLRTKPGKSSVSMYERVQRPYEYWFYFIHENIF